MPEGDVCAVCYDAEGELVSAHKEHQHLFHYDCLRQSLEHSEYMKCPLCSLLIDNTFSLCASPEESAFIDVFYSGSPEEIREKIRATLSFQCGLWLDLLILMISVNRPERIKLLLGEMGPYDDRFKPIFCDLLVYSTEKGFLEIIEVLLNYGVNPSTSNNYALFTAIDVENLPVVRMLVEHGACLKTNFPIIFAKLAQKKVSWSICYPSRPRASKNTFQRLCWRLWNWVGWED